MGPIYIQWSSWGWWWWESTKDEPHVQPTFQKENGHMPKTSPKQTCHKKKEETNVERWGNRNGGHDEEN